MWKIFQIIFQPIIWALTMITDSFYLIWDNVHATTKTPKIKNYENFSENERRASVVLGLCVGDSLGATSEYENPKEVNKNCVLVHGGWPGLLVGGGKEHWLPGHPTDDSEMALFLLKALKQDPQGKYIPANGVNAFFMFRDTQKDLGTTTKYALSKCSEENPYVGAKEYYQKNPELIANGSLMRNGVVGAWFSKEEQEEEAIEATVLQGLITHYNPTSAIVCVLQTLLIRKALLSSSRPTSPPTINDIIEMIKVPWTQWKINTKNTDCVEWLNFVGEEEINRAENTIINELRNFENFNPYTFDYYEGKIMGSSILALKIALWALFWSFQNKPYPKIYNDLPAWPFKRHGFEVIMWIVLIGADADTYGACAGPILAAYHPYIPENLLEGLKLKPVVDNLFSVAKQ